jgi:adenine phosphoribosyltransferase
MDPAKSLLLEHFRWVEGHADVWRVFRDATALRTIIASLVEPFRAAGITAVAGIESRGFLLGGAAAVELGVGFVAIRKAGALFPGEKMRTVTSPDYRGKQTELLMQRAAIGAGDRVLLVDDWIEIGSQARAVAELVSRCGGQLVAITVMIDQLRDVSRETLPPVHSILLATDLPPD